MNNITLQFEANEQVLQNNSTITKYTSDTIEYIKAVFTLGTNWTGFDIVKAIWSNGNSVIATILNSNGECSVPLEVLQKVTTVKVNLVGINIVNNVSVERLTTAPIIALTVVKKANIDGSETVEVTPSQFEQFVNECSNIMSNIFSFTEEDGNIIIAKRR